jgi:cardiolipin synthase
MSPAPPDPRYELRHLLLVPSLLSLARLPLAALFPFVAHRLSWALAVLVASAFSDLLDGWLARRWNQCTPLGAALDGATDKVFVLTVAVTLAVTHRLSVVELLLLGARDLGELALLAVIAARGEAKALHEEQRAAVWGKAATVVQFVTVVLALAGRPERLWAAALAGALGAAAVAFYARRGL